MPCANTSPQWIVRYVLTLTNSWYLNDQIFETSVDRLHPIFGLVIFFSEVYLTLEKCNQIFLIQYLDKFDELLLLILTVNNLAIKKFNNS